MNTTNIKTRTTAALMSFLLISSSLLSGCSSSDSSSENSDGENIFHVVTYANITDENFADTITKNLTENTVSLNQSQPKAVINVENVLMGDSSSDPTTAMGGVLKLSTMIIDKEIDILITSHDQLESNTDQDGFISLDELYTQEELDSMGVETLSFENSSGESGVYAVDLSESEELKAALNEENVGAGIIVNTPDTELSKDIFTTLIEMYSSTEEQ